MHSKTKTKKTHHSSTALISEWFGHWKKDSIEKGLKQIQYESMYTSSFLTYFKKGDVVLEAGCGLSRYCVWLENQGINTYGIDIIKEAIIEGKRYMKKHGYKSELKVGDVRKLPYSSNKFDGYISLGVLEHFESFDDVRKSLAEAFRVLKPGGRVFISIPNPIAIHMIPEKIMDVIGIKSGITHYPLNKQDLLKVAKENKFIIVTHGVHDFYFPIYSYFYMILRRDIWMLKSFLKYTLNVFDSMPVLKDFGSGIHVVLQKPL